MAAEAQGIPRYFNDDPQCAIRHVTTHLGSKWATMILLLLSQETLRFGELRKRIENISQRMLTQTLRQLERDGLVSREAYAEVPPRVDYALTELGHSAVTALLPLVIWARDKKSEIDKSRERCISTN